MDVAIAVIAVIVAVVCGFIGSDNLRAKGRDPLLGFAIGFFFGIIGVVLTVAMDPSYEHRLRAHQEMVRQFEAYRQRSDARIRGSRPLSKASPVENWLTNARDKSEQVAQEGQERNRQLVEERIRDNLRKAHERAEVEPSGAVARAPLDRFLELHEDDDEVVGKSRE